MDEDENLSMLLAMGFPDIGEAKRALRIAKNDINEAVAILTNEQPISNEIDMHDISASGKNDTENTSGDGGFPTTNLYELEQRVFQVSDVKQMIHTIVMRTKTLHVKANVQLSKVSSCYLTILTIFYIF